MAFDMYSGDAAHEVIGHHEEFLFALAQVDDARYPQLLAIWEAFYDGPRVSADQAGLVVHELVDLLALNGGLANKPLAAVVVRLLPFFSRTYRAALEVRCSSD